MKELKLIDPKIKNFTDFLYVNLIEARIILWILLLTVTFFALQIFELSLNETYENILKQTTEALIISILGFLSVFSVFLFFSIISFTRNRNVSISFKGSYIFYKGKAFKPVSYTHLT